MKNIKKIIYFTLILFFSLAFIGVIYALNTWSTGYRIDTETKQVLVNSTQDCYNVTNITPNAYFLPTKTTAEWNTFETHLPSGVTIGSCVPAYSYYKIGNFTDEGEWGGIGELQFKINGVWQTNAATSYTNGSVAGTNITAITSSPTTYYSTNYPWKAFDGTVPGEGWKIPDYWISTNWLQVQLDTPISATAVSVSYWADSTSRYSVYGSNDGSNWDNLGTTTFPVGTLNTEITFSSP